MKLFRKYKDGIALRLYISVFLLLFSTILLTGFACARIALDIKENDQDTIIRDYAEMIGKMDEVKEMVRLDTPDPQLRERLDYLTAHFSIPLNSAHRAWCDAEATARLYLILQQF